MYIYQQSWTNAQLNVGRRGSRAGAVNKLLQNFWSELFAKIHLHLPALVYNLLCFHFVLQNSYFRFWKYWNGIAKISFHCILFTYLFAVSFSRFAISFIFLVLPYLFSRHAIFSDLFCHIFRLFCFAICLLDMPYFLPYLFSGFIFFAMSQYLAISQ